MTKKQINIPTDFQRKINSSKLLSEAEKQAFIRYAVYFTSKERQELFAII